jgi:glycerol uptake facilitator-like aquaporin
MTPTPCHHIFVYPLAFLIRFTSTVIWETAVSPKSTCGNNAIIAIGFAVFVAHMLLIPIDGCSINPASRSRAKSKLAILILLC